MATTASQMPAISAGPSAQLSVRERMRLAKLALIKDEDRELEHRRERRKSRRASSVASLASTSSGPLPSPAMSSPTYTPADPRGILRKPSRSTFALEPISPCSSRLSSEYNPRLSAYSSMTTGSISRRSSRVRFSADHLPSANSSPRSSAADIKRKSSVDGLRADLERARGYLKRESTASLAPSTVSDQFELSDSAPKSSIADGNGEAFRPLPLRYPKVGRRLSTLSRQTSASSINKVPATPPHPPRSELRELLGQPSVNISPVKTVLPTGPTGSASPCECVPRGPQLPNSSSSVPSQASITSTLQPAASTGRTFSTVTSSLISYGLSMGPGYSSILPTTQRSESLAIPAINRQPWHDGGLGLCLRSGPSPIVQTSSASKDMADVDRAAIAETCNLASQLPARISPTWQFDSARTSLTDSIDLLSLAPMRETLPLNIRRKPPPILHSRGDSFAVDMSFPLPPNRVSPQLAITLTDSQASRVSEVVQLALPSPEGVSCEIEGVPTPKQQESAVVPGSLLNTETRPATSSPRSKVCSLSVQVREDEDAQEETESQAELEVAAWPDSPILPQLQRKRSITESIDLSVDDEESDLDVKSSLIEAAVKSKVISPHSRLLASRTLPASRRLPVRRVASLDPIALCALGAATPESSGWSSSDSEEETCTARARLIARPMVARQVTEPIKPSREPLSPRVSAFQSDFAPVKDSAPSSSIARRHLGTAWQRPPSLQLDQSMRYSNGSQDSEFSTASGATEVVTPPGSVTSATRFAAAVEAHAMMEDRPMMSRSCSSASTPGNFAWGGPRHNSPPSSPKLLPAARFDDALLTSSCSGSPKKLPRPQREVDGWGAPEILVDEKEKEKDEGWELWMSSKAPGFFDHDFGSAVVMGQEEEVDEQARLRPASIPLSKWSPSQRSRILHPSQFRSLGYNRSPTRPSLSYQLARTSLLLSPSRPSPNSVPVAASEDITPKPPKPTRVPTPPTPPLRFEPGFEEWLLDEELPTLTPVVPRRSQEGLLKKSRSGLYSVGIAR